jgi:hypothetical protein
MKFSRFATRVVVCLAAWSASAVGQAYAQSYGTGIGAGTSFGASVAQYFYGQAVATSQLSGCSAGGSPSLTGNTAAMLVTAGSTASTTCTITWSPARPAAPTCAITSHTAAAGAPFITVESTTTLTWTFTSVGSSVWDVICLQAQAP